ncbi:MAG: RNA ligase family protein [Candidatus Aenigmarchaeota archaeon]|nr:RNA ligase family protein [Candidatus Aenigmarchaeota archaeon]
MRYPSIPYFGELDEKEFMGLLSSDVQVFEKLDGGNTQIEVRNDGTVRHGLRSGSVNRKTSGRVSWADDFNAFFWSNCGRFRDLEKGMVYFLEFLAPHHVVYHDEFVNMAFLIDAYSTDNARFVDYDEAWERASPVHDIIHKAELLHKGPVDDKTLLKILNRKSRLAVNGIGEGIVIKDYGSRHQSFTKIIHPFYESYHYSHLSKEKKNKMPEYTAKGLKKYLEQLC